MHDDTLNQIREHRSPKHLANCTMLTNHAIAIYIAPPFVLYFSPFKYIKILLKIPTPRAIVLPSPNSQPIIKTGQTRSLFIFPMRKCGEKRSKTRLIKSHWVVQVVTLQFVAMCHFVLGIMEFPSSQGFLHLCIWAI